MAYKEIAARKKYFKYRECDEGEVLVDGTYLREVMGKYGIQYEFEDKDGDIVVLNGSGQLKYKMDFVKEGDKVKIVYDGVTVLESGPMKGKDCHCFKLYRDSEPADEDELFDDLEDEDEEFGL